MNLDLEAAKTALIQIVEREWHLRETAPDEHLQYMEQKFPRTDWSGYIEKCLFLSQDMPEIIPGGTNQVVFQLDGGYIGKARTKKRSQKTSRHYVVESSYASTSEATFRALQDLGFDVPDHHYVSVERRGEIFTVKNHGLMFAIAEDLAQQGGFRVEDVTEEHFGSLENGAGLRKDFKKSCKTIYDISKMKNPEYSISFSAHGTITDPQEAIRRTFLIQIDVQANTGRLVAGDLDNILVIGPRDSG